MYDNDFETQKEIRSYTKYWTFHVTCVSCIQLFQERLSEKVHATILTLLWNCQASEQLIQALCTLCNYAGANAIVFLWSPLCSFLLVPNYWIIIFIIVPETNRPNTNIILEFQGQTSYFKAQLHFGVVSLTVTLQLVQFECTCTCSTPLYVRRCALNHKLVHVNPA